MRARVSFLEFGEVEVDHKKLPKQHKLIKYDTNPKN